MSKYNDVFDCSMIKHGKIANERQISATHESHKGIRTFNSTELPTSAKLLLTQVSLLDEWNLWGSAAFECVESYNIVICVSLSVWD